MRGEEKMVEQEHDGQENKVIYLDKEIEQQEEKQMKDIHTFTRFTWIKRKARREKKDEN